MRLDDVEQRRRADRTTGRCGSPHQRGVHRGDVHLDHLLGHASGEELDRAAGVALELFLATGRAVGQRGPAVQVRSHQHRLQDAHGRPGGRELLVAARRHPGQGEGRAQQPLREAVHLGDVVLGVAPDEVGVSTIGPVDLGAGNVGALRRGDAEVPRDVLQAVARPGRAPRNRAGARRPGCRSARGRRRCSAPGGASAGRRRAARGSGRVAPGHRAAPG